jgi:hypothetical protein
VTTPPDWIQILLIFLFENQKPWYIDLGRRLKRFVESGGSGEKERRKIFLP